MSIPEPGPPLLLIVSHPWSYTSASLYSNPKSYFLSRPNVPGISPSCIAPCGDLLSPLSGSVT